MIYIGGDWAEKLHDVHVMDDQGRRLASKRLPEGVEGMAQLHALVGVHTQNPEEVLIGIETDRGLKASRCWRGPISRWWSRTRSAGLV